MILFRGTVYPAYGSYMHFAFVRCLFDLFVMVVVVVLSIACYTFTIHILMCGLCEKRNSIICMDVCRVDYCLCMWIRY